MLLVGLVAGAGTLVSLLGYWALTVKQYRLIEAKLGVDAEQRARAVERRFRHAITTIYPVSAFVSPSHPADLTEFYGLAERFLDANHDLDAVYWLPQVRPGTLQQHEQSVRDHWHPDYKVRRWDDTGHLPVAPAEGNQFLLPLCFAADNSGGTEPLLGLDMMTVPQLQTSLIEAVLSRQVAVTTPTEWGSGARQRMVFLAFRAVYDDSRGADTLDEVWEQLLGVVAVAIRADAVMADSLATFASGIDVQLFGESEGAGRRLLCEYDSEDDVARYAPETSTDDGPVARVAAIPLDVPGRRWSIECHAHKVYFARRASPLALVTLCFGLLLAVLSATYANTLLGRTEKISRLVVQRTAELDYERFLLNTLLAYSPDYIYFKDPEGRFLRVSQALVAHFRAREPAEVLGKTDFDFFPPEQARKFQADEQRVMQGGQPLIDQPEPQPSVDGQPAWVSTSKVPLRAPDGTIVGTFGISRDITLRIRAEEALRVAKEAAEAASRAKSDFLANMSHEIRTPLNAVIGMTELVLETELSGPQREYLKMVLESGESLLSVVDDILDFSKIEAGRLSLQTAEFDLRDDLGDAMKSLAFRAHRKGLELICEIQPDVPERLVGDLGRLRQVLVNLVGNAVKFTERGEVVVQVSCPSQTEQDAVVQFAVRDTGIGIAPDHQQRIFDAFEQVDPSRSRRFGGTGLGLAICLRLVGFLGGRIWLESQLGRGSTFYFTARFGLAGARQPPPAAPAAVHGTRVLIVDDNETNRHILAEMCRNWGLQPATAPNADEALAALRTAQQESASYPLVLVDADMPGVDGFAFVQEVVRNTGLAGRIIMMLTSGNRPGEIARCEQLGAAAYLLKPIKQSELFDAVVLALGITTPEEEPVAAPPAPPAPPPLPALRVLVVEDSLVNQKLAVGLLEKRGHRVAVANHGREALAATESQEFDVVLMDLQMPEMDGYEATAAIRARERFTGRHLPIIAMTAHAMKGDRERCLEADMDAYIVKPIRAQRLLETIAAVLRGERDH
jgi:PAS domain S-box-containing protein